MTYIIPSLGLHMHILHQILSRRDNRLAVSPFLFFLLVQYLCLLYVNISMSSPVRHNLSFGMFVCPLICVHDHHNISLFVSIFCTCVYVCLIMSLYLPGPVVYLWVPPAPATAICLSIPTQLATCPPAPASAPTCPWACMPVGLCRCRGVSLSASCRV